VSLDVNSCFSQTGFASPEEPACDHLSAERLGQIISAPTPSGTVLFDSLVVLFSLGCNPRFGEPSGTQSAVSRALALFIKA
jgi:hypothetical protein